MVAGRTIREAKPADYAAISRIVTAAFTGSRMGYQGEAEIVDKARAEGSAVIDLVAEAGDEIVGHILFTRMSTDRPDVSLLALGPVAVSPEHQNGDHGGALIRAGLDECRRLKADGVILLGHPTYYPRFGFSADAAANIASPYAGSPAFQALALTPGVFDQPIRADYPPAFG